MIIKKINNNLQSDTTDFRFVFNSAKIKFVSPKNDLMTNYYLDYIFLIETLSGIISTFQVCLGRSRI